MSLIALDDADGILSLLRDSVGTFTARNPGPERLRRQRASGTMDRETWNTLASSGWIGLQVPEERGGAGLGPGEQSVVSEAIGRGLGCEPYAMLAVLVPALLASLPESATRETLLAGLLDGSRLVTLAFQAHAGNSGLVAEAQSDEGWVLSGTASHVEIFGEATDILLVAKTAKGIALFHCDPRAQGLSAERREAVDGSGLWDIACKDMSLDKASLLAQASSFDELMIEALQKARLALAAELAGLTGKALEETVEYTRQRVQFGKPIASFQVIQHRLVDMWIQSELANASVRNAVVQTQRDPGSSAAFQAICAAKARAGEAASFVCRNAIHLHGAMGITDECNIGLYLKRAINLSASLGNADVMRELFLQHDSHNQQ